MKSVRGRVVDDWHVAYDPPYEIVHLSGYDEIDFIVQSPLFDDLGICEGDEWQFSVEPRDSSKYEAAGNVYEILEGRCLRRSAPLIDESDSLEGLNESQLLELAEKYDAKLFGSFKNFAKSEKKLGK